MIVTMVQDQDDFEEPEEVQKRPVDLGGGEQDGAS